MERRAKSTDLSSYSPIPSDGELCAAVLLHCAEPAAEVCVYESDHLEIKSSLIKTNS